MNVWFVQMPSFTVFKTGHVFFFLFDNEEQKLVVKQHFGYKI